MAPPARTSVAQCLLLNILEIPTTVATVYPPTLNQGLLHPAPSGPSLVAKGLQADHKNSGGVLDVVVVVVSEIRHKGVSHLPYVKVKRNRIGVPDIASVNCLRLHRAKCGNRKRDDAE